MEPPGWPFTDEQVHHCLQLLLSTNLSTVVVKPAVKHDGGHRHLYPKDQGVQDEGK